MALALVFGAAAGFAVLALGGSREWSMAATFFAAFAPVTWHVRKNRTTREGGD